MSKKAIWGMVIAVVVIAGLIWYFNSNKSKGTTTTNGTATI